MNTHDPEIQQLRENVNCAAVLERLPPPWALDRRESTKESLKYRRGDEILIVNHEGHGWWNPKGDEKGDVFNLVQFLEPGLNFGEVRKVLRPLAGVAPTLRPDARRKKRLTAAVAFADRWASRGRIERNSPAWLYLSEERGLPASVLAAAAAAGVLRQGAYGSPWFAHQDEAGVVTHIEIRSENWKGSVRRGVKTLFRLPGGPGLLPRLVLTEAAIDALSVAAIENIRADSLYAATGGGMGSRSIEIIAGLLSAMAGAPAALLCSATDANPPGERFAAQHARLAAEAGVAFERLRPPLEGADWNDILLRNIAAEANR
jgi:hypothetical protein